jgi:hypothetical protein
MQGEVVTEAVVKRLEGLQQHLGGGGRNERS